MIIGKEMFRDLFNTSRIIELLIRIPCILIALTVHEAAHGYVAAKMGDKTAADVDIIPTGSIALDMALGIGGIPRGRVVEIYGP